MKQARRVFLMVILTTVIAGPVFGQGRGRGQGNSASSQQSTVERIIREWFGNTQNLQGLPPGLAKRETLPPGLARQLRERGQLPPGLQRRVQDLPHDLVIRLPWPGDNRRWVMIGGHAILLNETTSAIVNIIEDVF
jgi:hypothetical protein